MTCQIDQLYYTYQLRDVSNKIAFILSVSVVHDFMSFTVGLQNETLKKCELGELINISFLQSVVETSISIRQLSLSHHRIILVPHLVALNVHGG